ncbi:MAG: exo-alpha-sialidase, partial [Chloroflexota bacterium]|nr:exo-alpha-sialidase [Chloroflexota bacterium]
SNGGARGLVTARSTDGGRRWNEREVPFGACARRGSNVVRISSPSLSIGPEGVAYLAASAMSAASFSATGSADAEAPFDTLLVATSRNDGASWTNLHSLPFNAGTVTKVSMTADPRRRGTAYVVWDSDVGSWFSRTTNGGTSWSKPTLIVPGQPTLPVSAGNVIIVDPRTDTLDLVYDLIHPVSKPRTYCGEWAGRRGCHSYSSPAGLAPEGVDLMIMSSRDGGRTWSRSGLIAQDLGIGRVGPRDSEWTWTALHRPAAAADPRTGDISVVWQDSRFSLGRFDEVALSISDRNGQHWSTPVRVDSGKGAAVLPSVAINSRGVTGIAYYQLRGLPAGLRIPAADYWFRAAAAAGHLAAPRRVTGPLELGRSPLAVAPFIVHTEGMASVGATFHPVFVVTRGMLQTDVVAATIP